MLRDQLAAAMGVDSEAMTLKDGHAIAENAACRSPQLVGDGIEATGQIAPGKQEKQFTRPATARISSR